MISTDHTRNRPGSAISWSLWALRERTACRVDQPRPVLANAKPEAPSAN